MFENSKETDGIKYSRNKFLDMAMFPGVVDQFNRGRLAPPPFWTRANLSVIPVLLLYVMLKDGPASHLSENPESDHFSPRWVGLLQVDLYNDDDSVEKSHQKFCTYMELESYGEFF